MCGPPRGLAAGAVYNHQAASLVLFYPLPSSFLPLPVFYFFRLFFSMIATFKKVQKRGVEVNNMSTRLSVVSIEFNIWSTEMGFSVADVCFKT